MMKVAWDLDGVLRDLSGHIARINKCNYPTEWDYKYNGKSIYECIDENPDVLLEAPTTAYLFVLRKSFDNPEIWTCQPEKWRSKTLMWIHRHIGLRFRIHFLSGTEKEEKLKKEADYILIEDSPKFTNYDRILLIDRPYNKGVRGAVRVFGTKHLSNLLEVAEQQRW